MLVDDTEFFIWYAVCTDVRWTDWDNTGLLRFWIIISREMTIMPTRRANIFRSLLQTPYLHSPTYWLSIRALAIESNGTNLTNMTYCEKNWKQKSASTHEYAARRLTLRSSSISRNNTKKLATNLPPTNRFRHPSTFVYHLQSAQMKTYYNIKSDINDIFSLKKNTSDILSRTSDRLEYLITIIFSWFLCIALLARKEKLSNWV